jgi:hypothetical protein
MLDDDEPVLERSHGTAIDWKPGKNITVKVRGCHQGGGQAHLGACWSTSGCFALVVDCQLSSTG